MKQLWIVNFTDAVEMLEVRKIHGKAHIAFLEKHEDAIIVGGGLREDIDQPFVGSIWIVSASDKRDVKKLVEADPYFEPKYRTYEIFAWGKAIDKPVHF